MRGRCGSRRPVGTYIPRPGRVRVLPRLARRLLGRRTVGGVEGVADVLAEAVDDQGGHDEPDAAKQEVSIEFYASWWLEFRRFDSNVARMLRYIRKMTYKVRHRRVRQEQIPHNDANNIFKKGSSQEPERHF